MKGSSSRRDDFSESSDDDYEHDENEMVSKTVFLFGTSGVGKSAFVHACAAEYNFQVIEVQPGQERCGSVLRETLSEATQSERLQKKNPMQSFFKTTKAKIEETKSETGSKDTLIYFSSVDLLFSEDEGFWRALKSFIDKTKVPIIFSAESIEANSGLNPEKENLDAEERQKCIEVSLEQMNKKDIVAIMRLISLDKGYYLSQENAFDLANYCHSYRQCLLMLQLWSCAYPAPNSSPVNDLCGIQKDEGSDSFTSQALYNRGNREKLAPFYHSGLRFIAVNRWKLIDAGARMRELNKCSSLEDDENIYKLRRFTSVMSLLDRKSCNAQETWCSAKSDTLHSTSRKAPADSNRHLPLQQEIQCYLETATLQSSLISERLALPSFEKEFHFTKPLPQEKAITSSSVNNKLRNYQNQVDGTCWAYPTYYSMGLNRFATDIIPAVAHIHREFIESGETNARGSRRRGGGLDYLQTKGFNWDTHDREFLSRPFPHVLKKET